VTGCARPRSSTHGAPRAGGQMRTLPGDRRHDRIAPDDPDGTRRTVVPTGRGPASAPVRRARGAADGTRA
jgi:hypothetical protein